MRNTGQITIGKTQPRLILKDRGCGDEIGQNLHQHLKVVANIFRLQHPSPTSVDVAVYGRKAEAWSKPEPLFQISK